MNSLESKTYLNMTDIPSRGPGVVLDTYQKGAIKSKNQDLQQKLGNKSNTESSDYMWMSSVIVKWEGTPEQKTRNTEFHKLKDSFDTKSSQYIDLRKVKQNYDITKKAIEARILSLESDINTKKDQFKSAELITSINNLNVKLSAEKKSLATLDKNYQKNYPTIDQLLTSLPGEINVVKESLTRHQNSQYDLIKTHYEKLYETKTSIIDQWRTTLTQQDLAIESELRKFQVNIDENIDKSDTFATEVSKRKEGKHIVNIRNLAKGKYQEFIKYLELEGKQHSLATMGDQYALARAQFDVLLYNQWKSDLSSISSGLAFVEKYYNTDIPKMYQEVISSYGGKISGYDSSGEYDLSTIYINAKKLLLAESKNLPKTTISITSGELNRVNTVSTSTVTRLNQITSVAAYNQSKVIDDYITSVVDFYDTTKDEKAIKRNTIDLIRTKTSLAKKRESLSEEANEEIKTTLRAEIIALQNKINELSGATSFNEEFRDELAVVMEEQEQKDKDGKVVMDENNKPVMLPGYRSFIKENYPTQPSSVIPSSQGDAKLFTEGIEPYTETPKLSFADVLNSDKTLPNGTTETN